MTLTSELFSCIGWPIGSSDYQPDPEFVEANVDPIFKSRVGLLYLSECERKGVQLGPSSLALLSSLRTRRELTQSVIVELADILDGLVPGGWTLFKSLKPFLSTPNDTDWFLFDRSIHEQICEELVNSGSFELLERAPLQTTLTHRMGRDIVDTTKRGGVYYVDCYVCPSTDYFEYVDVRLLEGHRSTVDLGVRTVPVLDAAAELMTSHLHNVFPERTYTHESYYLTKSYLSELVATGKVDEFVDLTRACRAEVPVIGNLQMTREIDRRLLGADSSNMDDLICELAGRRRVTFGNIDHEIRLPFQFSNRIFWRTFFSKQRDRVARRSTARQARVMLTNPVFLVDVLKVIWRRSVRGGVYEQN